MVRVPAKQTIGDLVRRVRLQVNANKHPRTLEALKALEHAMHAEFTKSRLRKSLQGNRALRNRVYYLQTKMDCLQGELDSYKSTKTSSGRVNAEWIVKVFLASPHASARALADSFRLVAGAESGIVSRESIHKIKCAWVEMYVSMAMNNTRELVNGHLRSCWRGQQQFLPVLLVHIQDEADIRLRSGDARDGPKLPRRGRSSKVQVHVLKLAVGHHQKEIPTELEALGDKSTGTLATSLEAVMSLVCLGNCLAAFF